MRQTRKQKKTPNKIQHHHLLLRMETKRCPGEEDKQKAKELVDHIIHDISMKPLGETRVFYVKNPAYNEGLTALCPIQTSHIAFHFWKNPDHNIFQNKESNCLLEFDLYTCGSLSTAQMSKILHHLTVFGPTHVNATLLNRNRTLTVEKQMIWDGDLYGSSWADWVNNLAK
jgi:S-adenosylmethionine/arginine decarboxylase-like enzyme